MQKKINTKTITTAALLTALHIVFVRLISLGSGAVRISLGFIPTAVAGMIFGPLGGGAVAAGADFLGTILFSKGEVYFFPFTISEFLYGFGFGLILHGKNFSGWILSILTTIQFIIINLFINSIWLYFYFLMIAGSPRGYWVIFSGRLTAALINLPMQIIGINLICRYLKKPLNMLGK